MFAKQVPYSVVFVCRELKFNPAGHIVGGMISWQMGRVERNVFCPCTWSKTEVEYSQPEFGAPNEKSDV